MTNVIKMAGAAALAGLVMVSAIAPASAAPYHHWHPYARHWVHNSQPPWNAGIYNGPAYYGSDYYGSGYYYDPGPAIIGGIFGAIAGAALSHAHHYRR